MAIHGTQVPIYTKHTLFLYFFDFSIFLYEKQNKQQKQVKQDNKTRMTQKKNKTLKLCKTKTRKEKISDRILRALSLPHLGRTFPLSKPLNLW